jgi:hypothetical protein
VGRSSAGAEALFINLGFDAALKRRSSTVLPAHGTTEVVPFPRIAPFPNGRESSFFATREETKIPRFARDDNGGIICF